eukprot:376498-Prorocentrum_minimum.AAC.7
MLSCTQTASIVNLRSSGWGPSHLYSPHMQVYSEYSGRQNVEVDDVKLAVRAVCSKSFTTPPSREVRPRGLQRETQQT